MLKERNTDLAVPDQLLTHLNIPTPNPLIILPVHIDRYPVVHVCTAPPIANMIAPRRTVKRLPLASASGAARRDVTADKGD